MKYFVFLISIALIPVACKKAEEPKLVIPDTTKNPAIDLKNAIDTLDKRKLKSSRTTLDALINLPGGGPIPPHLLPAKDIRLESETENTATYSFTSNIGVKVRVKMQRRVGAKDTVWVVSGVEEM